MYSESVRIRNFTAGWNWSQEAVSLFFGRRGSLVSELRIDHRIGKGNVFLYENVELRLQQAERGIILSGEINDYAAS